MSDYISKGAVIEALEKVKSEIQTPADTVWNNAVKVCIDNVIEAPTLSETEIIRKSFEIVVKRLEEKKQEYLEGFRVHQENELYGVACGFGDSIKICKEEGGIE